MTRAHPGPCFGGAGGPSSTMLALWPVPPLPSTCECASSQGISPSPLHFSMCWGLQQASLCPPHLSVCWGLQQASLRPTAPPHAPHITHHTRHVPHALARRAAQAGRSSKHGMLRHRPCAPMRGSGGSAHTACAVHAAWEVQFMQHFFACLRADARRRVRWVVLLPTTGGSARPGSSRENAPAW